MVRFGFSSVLAAATALLAGVVSAAPASELVQRQGAAAWPNGPLHTEGRWMKDASGNTVTYAGANWPGHGEIMIPEGLQYQSVEYIVSKLKSAGFNAIRLTYAIQMIDEIYDNGGVDIPLDKAFVQGLGQVNGTRLLAQFLSKNPQFTAKSTRLQVFDAVAAELAKQQMYIHLDNHISRGKWCCGASDNNAFWGDLDFHPGNWTRGLAYMAAHGKAWPALMSSALRNEPREPTSGPAKSTYNWETLYKYVKQGAAAINKANPDLLIFISGLNYDTFVTPIVRGQALSPGQTRFAWSDFAGFEDKLVLEIHNYDNNQGSCSALRNNLYNNGFEAHSDSAVNKFPVLLTEYGFPMDATTWQRVYASCIAQFTADNKAGFFIWVIVGSYYTREGIQDYDEGWGVLNHDWSDWRSPSYVQNQLIPQIRGTLAQ